MTTHLGRLVDHIHIRVADAQASLRFYRAVLGALGLQVEAKGDDFWCDEFYVSPAEGKVSSVHLAFQAAGPGKVAAFHAAGLAAGGRDNGAPGPRPYHPGYYAAFLLDPDGNNIEAVFHGPTRRSAQSISVSRTEQEGAE
ncbi:VOC family protein [Consotaella salsifontis]|uniref:Catechol 2,3-dioxygenase n=1 Tax=Consotaella salsifontis TaxID=1365950 RepID=A0A1T4NQC6_9HYPH|nr:VOC family protein [Consotaella salsifontis]SJZ81266.1 Catechol 2,3-dioxygenase [Consotaella salsifontis]